MCTFSSKRNQYAALYAALCRPGPSKKPHRRLHLGLLNRRRAQVKEARQRKRMIVVKEEIEMKNLKLYIENQSIMEENEKLRKKAIFLHKENQALLSQLRERLSQQKEHQSK